MLAGLISLASGAVAVVLVAGIAWTRGMAGWIVITLMAASAATTVIAAIRIQPTVIATRKSGRGTPG
jgi:hypothetical protein